MDDGDENEIDKEFEVRRRSSRIFLVQTSIVQELTHNRGLDKTT